VGECGRKWVSGRKWPESGLAVQRPCNSVTLCRNLRNVTLLPLFATSKPVGGYGFNVKALGFCT
jgi:hypothetical protein